MLTDNLFEEILLNPAKAGANTLKIVSGYATSAMASKHLARLAAVNDKIKINLILGMTPVDGLSATNHKGFVQLVNQLGDSRFTCSYLFQTPQIHAKIYSWYRNNQPFKGFVGSANYTQVAFSKSQREAMTDADPVAIAEYFDTLSHQTIYCENNEVENLIPIYLKRKEIVEIDALGGKELQPNQEDITKEQKIKISFLDSYGNLPQRSGLNWGQRPEAKREPNQAYIRVPALVARSAFFPDRSIQFTILTDDDKILICAVAQDGDKAIHTTQNNSQFGEYFRGRLGVANGMPITKNDLLKYGRTDVSFYKIDDETYFMDFSA